MIPNLHDDFGVRSTYSATENNAGLVRMLDYVSRNPHCEIAAHAKEFDRDGPVTLNISEAIEIEHPLTLRGGGGGYQHSADPNVRDCAVALNWVGLAGAPILKAAPAPGGRQLFGVKISGFGLFGNDVAGRCLDIRSLAEFEITDLFVNGATDTAIYGGVVDYALATSERRDCVHGILKARIAQIGSASGKGAVFDGDDVANFCKNTLEFSAAAHKNAPAFDLVNTDSNTWEDCVIHNWGLASVPGMVLRGGANTGHRSRSEVFEFLECGSGGVTVEGTDVAAVASYGHDAYWNIENCPVSLLRIGPGASFDVTNLACRYRAGKYATQSFSGSTFQDVTAWHEFYDHGSAFDGASGVFTAPITGVYRFKWSLFHANTITPGSRWHIQLTRSGSGGNCGTSYTAPGAIYNSVSDSAEMALAQGETVRLQVRCVGGSGVFDIFSDASLTRFEGGIVR